MDDLILFHIFLQLYHYYYLLYDRSCLSHLSILPGSIILFDISNEEYLINLYHHFPFSLSSSYNPIAANNGIKSYPFGFILPILLIK